MAKNTAKDGGDPSQLRYPSKSIPWFIDELFVLNTGLKAGWYAGSGTRTATSSLTDRVDNMDHRLAYLENSSGLPPNPIQAPALGPLPPYVPVPGAKGIPSTILVAAPKDVPVVKITPAKGADVEFTVANTQSGKSVPFLTPADSIFSSAATKATAATTISLGPTPKPQQEHQPNLGGHKRPLGAIDASPTPAPRPVKKPKTGTSTPKPQAAGKAHPRIRTWLDRVEDSDIDGFNPNDNGDTTDYDSDKTAGPVRAKFGGVAGKKPAPKKIPAKKASPGGRVICELYRRLPADTIPTKKPTKRPAPVEDSSNKDAAPAKKAPKTTAAKTTSAKKTAGKTTTSKTTSTSAKKPTAKKPAPAEEMDAESSASEHENLAGGGAGSGLPSDSDSDEDSSSFSDPDADNASSSSSSSDDEQRPSKKTPKAKPTKAKTPVSKTPANKAGIGRPQPASGTGRPQPASGTGRPQPASGTGRPQPASGTGRSQPPSTPVQTTGLTTPAAPKKEGTRRARGPNVPWHKEDEDSETCHAWTDSDPSPWPEESSLDLTNTSEEEEEEEEEDDRPWWEINPNRPPTPDPFLGPSSSSGSSSSESAEEEEEEEEEAINPQVPSSSSGSSSSSSDELETASERGEEEEEEKPAFNPLECEGYPECPLHWNVPARESHRGLTNEEKEAKKKLYFNQWVDAEEEHMKLHAREEKKIKRALYRQRMKTREANAAKADAKADAKAKKAKAKSTATGKVSKTTIQTATKTTGKATGKATGRVTKTTTATATTTTTKATSKNRGKATGKK